MLRKILETKLSAKKGERAVIAKISTISVDRDGDVMLPSGADFTDFAKNPVVLFGHDAGQIPVGKAVALQTRSRDIVAKVLFAERPKEHPESQEWVPDTLLSLFQQGMLNAFSVGFTIDEEREANRRDKARFGDDVYRVITGWKLVEFSVVPVPANQDALAVAVSKGYVEQNSWTHNELELASFENESTKFVLNTPARFIISADR
jgi:HK97 family phage prohead protease